jgi:outer membrane protein assembly complex protein YaeT
MRPLLALSIALAILLPALPLGAQSPAGSDTELPSEAPALQVERVARLEWIGVESLEVSDLEAHIFTRQRDWHFWQERPEFIRATLDQDVESIRSYYRNSGFYEVRVRYELTRRADGSLVEITIQVEEGEPVRIETIEIELAPGVDMPDAEVDVLAASLPIEAGEIFSVAGYRAARDLLLRHFADRAHPRARIEGGADVDVASRRARISWLVQPGPLVRFGPIELVGLDKVQEHVVTRELRLAEGEPYSLRALEKTRRRLLDLQLFRVVIVTLERLGDEQGSEPQDWPIEIELSERKPRTISLGAGFGSGEKFRGRASWTHRNFLGDGRSLRLSAGGSDLEQRAGARLIQPYLFGTRASGEVVASWLRRSRDSYDANEVNLRLGPKRNFGPHWTGQAAYRIGWTGVSNLREEQNRVLRDQDDPGLLSGFDVGFRRSQLDVKNDPEQGTYLDLRLSPNFSGLGSNWDFVRYEVDLRGYLPLGPSVIAARLRARTVDPFGATDPDQVPLAERLFLGGPHTGRGFSFEKLGPLDSHGDPVGGTSSVLASIEWRVPLFWRLTMVGFVDVGQVNLEPFELDGDSWGVGAGPGLAVATPIGPLTFYAGYPIEPVEQSQKWRFYFAVGHAF